MSDTKRVQLSFAQSFQVCSALQAFYSEAVAAGWGYRKVLREIKDRTQIVITINQLRTVFDATGLDSTPFANKDRINNPNRKQYQINSQRIGKLESDMNADLVARVDLEAKYAELDEGLFRMTGIIAKLEDEIIKLKSDLGVK